ncbi:EF-hand domain-containing protein [Pelagovum pacificum]|uniref:EF-hand domain-containing protein n=1 Tax=Pelagovum pacificum TaxID=2588711 RepID=A0A5C5GIE1_9RHOB|nr:EF-hand domain-containing protein [Pelagovum pacificum]QQA43649.1 EF-hand domain-containing protein [Pelagovum pacificum]TNY33216.1 hypothetical protein FHY64_08055 [Pelagovum pacificum]
MTYKTVLLLVAIGAGYGVTAANAQGLGPMGMEPPTFESLDTDGDGQLSEAELRAPVQERFDAADTDGDGTLTAEEMTAAAEAMRAERQQQMVARMISRLDANGDGVLSVEEFRMPAPRPTMFSRLDTDENGAISPAEFEQARERMHAFAERRGPGGPGRDHGGLRDGHGNGPRFFR